MSSSSPNGCYDDLQQWAALAQHTLLASDRLLADEIKRRIIALAVYSLRSAARRLDVNHNNALVQLPHALLGRILVELVSTSDIAAVSQSCGRLRLLMTDSPHYWNRFTILIAGQNLMFQRFILQHSRPAPLDLHVHIHAVAGQHGWNESCLRLVKDNMDRLYQLVLILERPLDVVHDRWGEAYLSPDFANPVEDHHVVSELWNLADHLLKTPAPLLRALTLERQARSPEQRHVLPKDLFCGEAPRLVSCTMVGVIFPSQRVKAFSSLVSLHYHALDLQPAELNLISFGRILDGLPLLEELGFRGHWFSLGNEAETHSSPSRLRSVRMLDVPPTPFDVSPDTGLQPAELPRVHGFFNKRGVWRFECAFVGGGFYHAFTAPETLLQAYPRIESICNLLPHVEFRSGATTVAVLRNFWDPVHFASIAAVYANLEHLTIHEYFWPKYDALPEAPRLETLCIVLSSISEVEVFGRQSCSLSQADGAWACPALRSLVFSYPPPRARRCSPSKRPVDLHHPTKSIRSYTFADGDTLPVSLRDVHYFVATCLRFARARLAVLELVGVEPVDPDAWELLYAVADDVQISSTVNAALVDRIAWDWCVDDY